MSVVSPVATLRDWSAYNAGQTAEADLFEVMLRDLLDGVPEPEQTTGRPRLPLKTGLYCAIHKVHSQLSSRRAQGRIQQAAERGRLDHAPHFNTTSKLLNRADVTPILYELVSASALPLASIEEDFAIDSSGFRTTSFDAWCVGRHGMVKPHAWIKVHICAGVKTHVVARVVVTDDHGPGSGDTSQFQNLLRGTADAGFSVRNVMADKAYSSRSNLQFAADMGTQTFIPFRIDAKGQSKCGAPAWRKAYHFFQLCRSEFDARYHKRSNVESVFSAIKRKFGEVLKSKNRVAQENEVLCKIIAYNISVLIQQMHESGVDTRFLWSPRDYTSP